jgi:regulator of replication initiation timing
MSAFTRMKEERDELYEKVAELEREVRLMRQQYFRRLEERDALESERDELRESVKDLLDLTEYGDIDGMVWELVNDGDEWVVERLNRAQRLIDDGGE